MSAVDDTGLPGDLPRYMAGLLALGIILAIVFFRRSDFVIRVQDGRLACTGKLPLSQIALRELLVDDLGLAGPVKISGCRRGGRLHLWFRGDLTKGQEQRIRNYLLASQR
jgi:hypothetical protein